MPISRLLLPLPFGPMIATDSPVAMLNVASCTATRFPYETDIPLTPSAVLAGSLTAPPARPGRARGARPPRAAAGPGADRSAATPSPPAREAESGSPGEDPIQFLQRLGWPS